MKKVLEACIDQILQFDSEKEFEVFVEGLERKPQQFKVVNHYNNKEIPLIKMVKSLQDGLNLIESNFQNQMEEDPRNTILVVVNYDGENLGEFRRNLATYGTVKVRTVDGAGGDVRTLQIEVNADNYKAIIELFKKAIIHHYKRRSSSFH